MTKPFLKWAGGKRWQLEHLIPLIQERLTPDALYFEPFVGGGALFLALDHPHKRLSDINGPLIATYQAVRDHCWEVAAELQNLIEEYNADEDPKGYYYAARERWKELRLDVYSPGYLKAALFIFLNRTCFNGLYRENSKGEFNTPWGKKMQLKWASGEILGDVQEALSDHPFYAEPFHAIEEYVRRGDVIYCDPPYCTDTNGFSRYSASDFGPDDHTALASMALRLKAKGAHVIVSGSDTNQTRALYRGFSNVTSVVARRSIGAKTREKASELIMFA
jgi:DNA adenine methylase